MSTQSLVLQKVDRQPHQYLHSQTTPAHAAIVCWNTLSDSHTSRQMRNMPPLLDLRTTTFRQNYKRFDKKNDPQSRWIFYWPLFQYLQQTNFVTGIIVWSRIFNFIFNKIWFPLHWALEHMKHETRSYSCHDKLNHINNPTNVVAALCCVVIELSTVLREISQRHHNKESINVHLALDSWLWKHS